eukprot:NODE_357_length_8846_cov_0.279410.p3 type:complete len:197 gc:universal NODE_357_length_8846_cov_0.279410:915-325(-)
MKKYFGTPSENFVFFRKEFESHMATCKWKNEATTDDPESIGCVQLKRALGGVTLQTYIEFLPYQSATEAVQKLQDIFVGADAHRKFFGKFRRLKQMQEESVDIYFYRFKQNVKCCNFLTPSADDKLSGRDQMNFFLDGKLKDIQSFANLQNVSNLSDAFSTAQRAEENMKLLSEQVNQKRKNNSPADPQMTQRIPA